MWDDNARRIIQRFRLLTECDLDWLKKIGWKSSLISLLVLSFFVGVGWLFGSYLDEVKIFNIDIFYILFAIFAFLNCSAMPIALQVFPTPVP